MSKRLSVSLALAVPLVLALVARHYVAVEGHDENSRPTSQYSALDVVEYTVFSTGKIPQEHPALATPGRHLTDLQILQLHDGAQHLTSCLEEQDRDFAQVIPANFQSGDPYRVESAIQRIGQVATQQRPMPQAGACTQPSPPPANPGADQAWYHTEPSVWNYSFAAFQVSVGAQAAVAAAEAAGAVFALWVAALLIQTAVAFTTFVPAVEFVYDDPGSVSQLAADEQIAKITRELRLN